MSSIKLSEKHGVNPTLLVCPVCLKDTGSIGLLGRLPGDAEAPFKVLDPQPCEECVKYMEQGVVLISVRDGEEGENPYRSGHFCVVKDDAIERMIVSPEAREGILKRRVAYVPDQVWEALGLPTTEEENVKQ